MTAGAVRIEVGMAEGFLNTAHIKAAEILSLKEEFTRELNTLAGITEGQMIAATLDRDGEFSKAVRLIHDRLCTMGEKLLMHAQQIAAMDQHGAAGMGSI